MQYYSNSGMEEEEIKLQMKYEPMLIPVCKCLRDDESSEQVKITARKQMILTTVARTQRYLQERRIPELIRFLLTKLISQGPDKPISYLEKLLDDCMLFRAGHGSGPVLYENKHLEAVVKSFDPGQRGWLSEGQIRRVYSTLGLTLFEPVDDRVPCDLVLKNLKQAQELDLFNLVSTGIATEERSDDSKSTSSI